MTIKNLIFACVIALLSFPSLSQTGKLKKADAYFGKLAYAYAADLYVKLIGTEVETPQLKSNLAQCYFQMGDMQNAELYYAQVVAAPEAKLDDYFYYAQTLKQNGKYAESDLWMQQFSDSLGTDLRAQSFIKNKTYIAAIEKQGERFSVKHITNNSSAADFGGYPLPNSSDVYFISSRTVKIPVQNEWSWNGRLFLDIYRSQADNNQELLNEVLVTKRINSRYHEGPLCFSPDGKTVYFTRNNIAKGFAERDGKGIQNLKLLKAAVDSLGNWTNEMELPFNSKDYSIGHPTISADGSTMYFASDMPGGFGGADIYSVTINADGTFGIPKNLGNTINTEGQEMFPWITNEGFLYFSSNGHIGLGGLDVFVVVPKKEGGFGKMFNAGRPMNGQHDDFAISMNADNKTGYFSSNRDGGNGDDDIYSYVLLKPFKVQLRLEGIITDQETGEILAGAPVLLKDSIGNVLATIITDAQGKYGFDVERELEYSIAIDSMPKYYSNARKVSTRGFEDLAELVQADMTLEKDPGLSLYCLVTDKTTGLPLSGVTIKILQKQDKSEFASILTTETGDLRKGLPGFKIGDKLSYTIELSKPGYLGQIATFEYTVNKPGRINIHESIDMAMAPISLYCLITEKGTGLPVQGASVKILNKDKSEFLVVNTPETGDMKKSLDGLKLGDKLSFIVEVSKAGYLEETFNFDYTINKPGQINIHEIIDVSLSKLDVGQDLASMIELKPILFDVGKYTIRKDAAIELNKIIEIMNQYPTMSVELGSHTDCRGTIAANTTLSEKRANASAEYIKKRITNPERIYGKGYGETKLKVDCPCEGKVKSTCPDSEHQKNRRTEFIIMKM
jgi:outer membrane protein OmpA-like peptidoglycan-associated protein/tetratricopeptide (TPR) repeat protein